MKKYWCHFERKIGRYWMSFVVLILRLPSIFRLNIVCCCRNLWICYLWSQMWKKKRSSALTFFSHEGGALFTTGYLSSAHWVLEVRLRNGPSVHNNGAVTTRRFLCVITVSSQTGAAISFLSMPVFVHFVHQWDLMWCVKAEKMVGWRNDKTTERKMTELSYQALCGGMNGCLNGKVKPKRSNCWKA